MPQNLEIPLPPLEEQRWIVEHLDGLSDRIQGLEKTTHIATPPSSTPSMSSPFLIPIRSMVHATESSRGQQRSAPEPASSAR